MKKLMALCLSVLMVLSMCSFTVMAEGTAVDFAAIANGQPATFVTGNLSLGENTITSSNEAVIATDGTVTRPIFEDATVSLTINGGEAVEVTVKAQTTNVLYSTDFSTDSSLVSQKFAEYPQWYTGNAVANDTAISGGKLNADHGTSADDDAGYLYIYYRPATISGTRPVTFSFEVSDVASLSVGIDIRLTGTKYDAEGNNVGKFDNQTVMSMRSGNKFSGYGTGHTAAAKNPASIKYDPATGEFWLNETKATVNLFDKGTTTEGATVSKVVITNILFVDAASTARGLYSIDNFVQYEDVPAEEALASATPAEKSAYYSQYLEAEYVANGGNFASLTTNLKFAPEEELIDGVSIAWTSSNPAVIAEDGTVNRPITEAATVTVTGTLSVEGAEDVVKAYTANVLPLTQSFVSETADAENLAVGSFVGATGWTPASIKDYERMNVAQDADGNKYYSICASAYQPSGSSPKYTFASYPTALAAGETLEFSARVRIPVKGGLANWGLLLNGNEMAEFIYYNQYLYDNDYDLGNDGYYGAGSARSDKNITANTWYKIKFEIYANEESATGYSVKCYIDDKLVGTHKTKSAVPATITSAAFLFTGRANMDSTTAPTTPVYFFDTDDIGIKVTKDINDVLTTLTDAQKVSYFKAIVEETVLENATAVGQELGLDAKYESLDLASYGVTVDWTSDNTTYIANDGTVVKLTAHGATATVNMTATITAGSASDTVTIPVTVGSETTLIDSVDYDDTSVSVGNATYGTDADYGSIVTMTNPTENTHKASGTLTSLTGAGRYDRVVFEADMKYTDDGASFASGGICLKTIAGRNGITVYLNYTTNKVQLTTTAAFANGSASGLEATASKTIYYQIPASVLAKGEGAWVHLMVDHNVLSQTYNIYLDGVLVNDVPILQAEMDLGENGGNAIRGYSLELSGKGTVCADNLKLYKYTDANAVEVNAALNAALIQFASDIQSPVLVNQQLPAMTIGRSWATNSKFNRDLNGSALKPTNVSTYTYVENGPQVTYAIDGQAVTAIDVDSPKEVQLTITASANGVTESKTVTRKVAPVAIRSLALGTANCLNGAWITGAAGTEKLIVAKYLGDALVGATVVDFAETEAWDSETSTGDRFDEANSLVNNLGTENPKVTAAYDQLKIFVVSADGITPLAYANAELHD